MRIHFVGIGGIGVSALARYYLEKGHKISGSDLVCSEITEALEKKGVKIFIGEHKKENLSKDADLVVYSSAVQKDNPELKKAKKLKIKCQSYPQALGKLTKQHFTIAITGTHGKSTTTAMIGLLLVKANFDPTIIVGTKLKEFNNSNCRVGKSKYLVIEACEHKESFLNYSPDIAVITNIEPDHLDYYKTFNNVKRAFDKFAKKLKKNGVLITEREYKNPKKFKKLKKILKVPGEHNISNALATLAVARVLKIPDKISFKALSEYKGIWRRFEITKILNLKPYTLINDYAHHPTEVQVTLKTAREKYSKKKIWCVFQPHQYQRTYHLFNDFIKVCRKNLIDKLIITDIYTVAGREKEYLKKKVNSEKLVKVINKKNVIYLPNENILNFLKENIQNIDVLIIMGAGDIYNLTNRLSTTLDKI
jgi:UDP-N-acetylmuramate--alanine ligase